MRSCTYPVHVCTCTCTGCMYMYCTYTCTCTYMIIFVIVLIKGAMTWHSHTIKLPLCTVSLGARAKLLAQETKATYQLHVLLKPWDCILVRHVVIVSVFRSLSSVIALDESTRKIPLCATSQYVATGFLCTLRSSKPRACLSFKIRASQSLQRSRTVCTHSSGRLKENSTNEIQIVTWINLST